jgi:HEPN domain-containing protein
MKTTADAVRGWIQKAESDLANAEMCLAAGKALDTACFHFQQAAEKYVKAYLTACGIHFPYMHNVEKLVGLCAGRDPAFSSIKILGQRLTPYAVELRYEAEFWPNREETEEARSAALAIKEFVVKRLPAGIQP